MKTKNQQRAFTLIELLIVVLIISILAAIASVNMTLVTNRARKAADASNLHTLITALQTYHIDYDDFPPADREAGPFQSHDTTFLAFGNGPAGGGSWDGVPWILYDLKYISDWRTLFCPKYLKLYGYGNTIRGNNPRFHNFRYAYNSSALSTGGHLGGDGNVMSGDTWILRDLYLSPRQGFYAGSFPDYPADFQYPWGEGLHENNLEHVVYADLGVRTVIGGTNTEPTN